MNLVTPYREADAIKRLQVAIKKAIEVLGKPLRVMEFCGGHTHAIMKHGIDQLLEGYVKFIHGPGCPVCVLPMGRVDLALALAEREDVILCTYGDVMRVPGSKRKSLKDLRAEGKDVRSLYSCLDALRIAEESPQKNVVFFAIGFETTTPQTAVLIKKARDMGLKNLSVVSNHVLTPEVLRYLLEGPELKVDAIIGPGHVSTIIGTLPYESVVKTHSKPIVISGFEPLDLMQAVYMIVRQFLEGRALVENQYKRAVDREGNTKALRLMEEVFEVRESFEWRGLGSIPRSALKIRSEFEEFDAERRFSFKLPVRREHPSCICGEVIKGLAEPTQCKLFGNPCNPSNPVGSCMVSSEGACNAYYRYKRTNP
ncbi:MAG: hydrogenase formation protein HypD [Aquificaceae bacterium]|nr:hydrogenase formation protein HypD [Aquificaceae bacterium]